MNTYQKIDLLSYKYKIHSLLAILNKIEFLQSVLFIYSKNNKTKVKKLNMNNIRIDWIDLTKGIAIFFNGMWAYKYSTIYKQLDMVFPYASIFYHIRNLI